VAHDNRVRPLVDRRRADVGRSTRGRGDREVGHPGRQQGDQFVVGPDRLRGQGLGRDPARAQRVDQFVVGGERGQVDRRQVDPGHLDLGQLDPVGLQPGRLGVGFAACPVGTGPGVREAAQLGTLFGSLVMTAARHPDLPFLCSCRRSCAAAPIESPGSDHPTG
jgi:hypothetical protein